MVGVHHHIVVLELDGEMIDSARADGGCGLRTEDELLRKLGVGVVVILGLVVEAGDVEGGGEAVVKHGAYLVHAVGAGACGIEVVDEVLEHDELLDAVGAPLRGHLVAGAPHDHGGRVAVVLDHVGNILSGPVLEDGAVAVGRLGTETPVVERLDHEHHAHLVAQLDQLGGGHIVGGADGVDAHILEELYLMAQGRTVDGGSEGAEVVVVADTLELGELAVEEEALLGDIFDGADAEAGVIVVELSAVDTQCGTGGVEGRRRGAPELGGADKEILCELLAVGMIYRGVGGHDLALGVENVGGHGDLLALCGSVNLHLEAHRGILLAHLGSGDVGAPGGDMQTRGVDHMDVAVEARAGIPAGGFLEILEVYLEEILARLDVIAEIDVKRVVSVWPEGYLLAVDLDMGVAHGSVKDERHGTSGGVGHLECGAVRALADEWESAGAACLLGLLGLAVLLHGHGLEVVGAVKGAIYGPVVGHTHGLPLGVGRGDPFGELPPLVEGGHVALGRGREGHHKRKPC